MLDRLKRVLGTRAGIFAAVALGVMLCAPSLTTGLAADDYIHELIAQHRALDGMTRRPLDLFTFATGRPDDAHRLIDQGVFPWWADPHVKLAFFRPLTSLTHALDYVLWPGSPLAMHAQNLLWFALALLAVALVYRRFFPPALAGLALLLYALDDAHGPAVGWIANRNAMVALAIALPALAFHDRWRRDGWRPGAWLAPLCLAAGLLGGESALAVLGYLVAHALTVERGPIAKRLGALVPYLGVVAIWRVIYRALGYGAARSGVYLDPVRRPLAFLRHLPVRASSLLASQFALPWSDFTPMYRYASAHLAHVMALIALATVALIALALLPLFRRDPIARMFGLGLLFATVPICATFPADRLLFFVGVGGMALIARIIDAPAGRGEKALAVAFVALHLVLAPPLLALRSQSMKTVEAPLLRADASLPRDPAVERETLVLVNPPSDLFAGYLQVGRAARGEPRPAHLRWLATGTSGVELVREDARTLTVRPTRGFVENLSEQMLEDPRRPIAPGTRLTLTGLTIEVGPAQVDGRPAEARFRFDRPLEDPSLRFFEWRGTGYVPFRPPPPGTRMTLPPTDFFRAVFAPPPTGMAPK